MILAVGITGHRSLADDPVSAQAVAASIGSLLETMSHAAGPASLCLVTMLAEGADLIAADEASRRSIPIVVVLPGSTGAYRSTFERPDWLPRFDAIVAGARSVTNLPCEAIGDADYERANHLILGQSDLMLAVWDGKPARGRGGSGDVVRDAVERDMPVIVIDPAAPEKASLIVMPREGDVARHAGVFPRVPARFALARTVKSVLASKTAASADADRSGR